MRLFLKTLCGLALSSFAISLMVLATRNGSGWHRITDPLSVAVVLPFVTGFSAIGLFTLMPLAMLLIRHRASFTRLLMALAIAGAGVGWLMLFWLPLSTTSIGAVAGAVTAAMWAVANRQFLRPEARA